MMEEIDRFQVPTAHSEMQPLVRGRAAGRPGPGGAPLEGREGIRPWGLYEGAPTAKVGGSPENALLGEGDLQSEKTVGDYQQCERRTWKGGGHGQQMQNAVG